MGTVKYTGPVASFHCPTNAEIRSLKVHFSPKQEGTGDSSPENVRPIVGWDGVEVSQHGKNLYSRDNVIPHTADDEWNCIVSGVKQKIAVNSWPRWTFIAPAIPNATYYWKTQCYDVGFLDKDTNILTYKAGWGNTSAKAPTNAAFVYHTWIKNESMSQEQLDAAFKTYDLYCDILPTVFEEQSSKKTDYEFGVLGKNKFNWNVEEGNASPTTSDYTTPRTFTLGMYIVGMSVNNYYRQNYTNWVLNPSVSNGVISFSSGGASGYGIAFPIKLSAGQTYFLSGTGNGAVGATYYDKDGNVISYQNGRLNNTITVPADTTTTLIGFYANASQTAYSFSNIQLELGSTATAYEPYDPKHTVYGGWVDLISGEVCEKYHKIIADGVNVKVNKVYDTYNDVIGAGIVYLNPEGVSWPTLGSKQNIFSDSITMYNTYGDSATRPIPRAVATNAGAQYVRFYVGYLSEHPEITTNADKLAFVNSYLQEHPVNIVYELKNYITYHIAPTTLQTFLGHNNVWSNADYVEVEYDLHETQDILNRKAFIMANQPHIVKPAATTLQNFKTDVIAPLKECKVYFSPVQEGTGDPSPDNVRAITGWTGCEVTRCGKNLIDESFLANANNYVNVGSYGYVYTNDIQLAPNTRYRFVWSNYDNNKLDIVLLYVSGANQYIVDNNAVKGYRQYTSGFTTSSTGTIRFGINKQSYSTIQDALDAIFTNGDLLLQLSTSDELYEPYSGTTLPIDWTTEAGTVYGGYVDLVRGEVWQTWDLKDLGTVNWTKYSNRAGVFYTAAINDFSSTSKLGVLCNKYISTHDNVTVQADKTIGDAFQLRARSFAIYDTDYIDATTEDFKIAMSGVIAAYPLATPTLITTLAPIQLKTLRGTNNIYSSANGNIELAYWGH